MDPTCIDLRERFGQRFKVRYEESYWAAYGPKATREAPWLQIIPGARGHVYPHSTTMLAATTNKSGPTARHLKALPFVQVWTDGSDGVTVLFSPDRLEEVAELLKLRRRRRITDQERDRLTELGRRHRFQPRQAAVQSSSGTLESTIDPEHDPEAVRSEKPLFDL